MRLFSPLWQKRDFLMEVEPGVCIPAELDDYMVYWVFVHGYRSDASVRLSRELILPGDTVVDVGAHIGLWVMGAARRAGEGGSVHAFEPVPENFARLASNLRRNRLERIQAVRLALSEGSGSLTMFKPTYNNSGHPSLGSREGVDVPFLVETTTLDRYCQERSLEPVDFVKIDVEGAELLVLRGSDRVLSTKVPPAILFEVNEETAARLAVSTRDVKRFLTNRGYSLFRLGGGRLHAVDPDVAEKPGDLFAFQPHHFRRHPILRTLRGD